MSKLWQDTLARLELNLSSQHFSTWIKPLKLVKIEQGTVHLEVPNRFVLDWVRENYSPLIQKILSELAAVDYRLQFNVAGQAKDHLPKNSPVANASDSPTKTIEKKNQQRAQCRPESESQIHLRRICFRFFKPVRLRRGHGGLE